MDPDYPEHWISETQRWRYKSINSVTIQYTTVQVQLLSKTGEVEAWSAVQSLIEGESLRIVSKCRED
jgi:hypothetical protein